MGENNLEVLKTEFSDKWKNVTKNLAYPYDYFNSIDDYEKPVSNSKKEFFSKLKNYYPSDEEREKTKENIKTFNNKMEKN